MYVQLNMPFTHCTSMYSLSFTGFFLNNTELKIFGHHWELCKLCSLSFTGFFFKYRIKIFGRHRESCKQDDANLLSNNIWLILLSASLVTRNSQSTNTLWTCAHKGALCYKRSNILLVIVLVLVYKGLAAAWVLCTPH